MQLHSLSIVDLHGALTLDVSFNEEITLLVGINGSGKTSVLNAVEWLLKPDMKQLATAVYSRLCLRFTEGKTPYILTATKSDALVILRIEGTKNPLKPITVRLLHEASLDDEMESKLYRGLMPEKDELPMWKLLKSFARPTAISLDRTLSAESDDVEYIETPRGPMARRARAKAPLAYVQEITSQKYAEFRSQAIIHDSELKAEIVMSALQNSDIDFQGSPLKPLNASDITKLEAKVISYLTSTVKSADIANQIHRFFESAKILTEKQNPESKQHDLLVDFVSSRYRQIERMAKAFNDFENKNAAAFRRLSAYLRAPRKIRTKLD